jgi:ferredoxin-NADP reductase
LLYSVRAPGAIFYRDQLQALSKKDSSFVVSYAYTRTVPKDWERPAGRIDKDLIRSATWPSSVAATCYICGPTGFVESVTDLLSMADNRRENIRTERFGPTGERK